MCSRSSQNHRQYYAGHLPFAVHFCCHCRAAVQSKSVALFGLAVLSLTCARTSLLGIEMRVFPPAEAWLFYRARNGPTRASLPRPAARRSGPHDPHPSVGARHLSTIFRCCPVIRAPLQSFGFSNTPNGVRIELSPKDP